MNSRIVIIDLSPFLDLDKPQSTPPYSIPAGCQPSGSGAYAVPRSLVNEELTVARVQVVAGAKDQRDGRTIAIKRISDVFLKDPVPAKRYSPRSSC